MFFVKNIKHLRKVRKLTQKDLAEALGMKSHQIVSRYEDGSVSPQLDVIQKIADFLGVELQELMFTDLEAGTKAESRVGDKDRITRLLEKELDRLEALEKEIKETPGALEALRKIAPELVKKIEES